MMTRVNHDVSEGDLRVIADQAHGYVGADLAALMTEGMYSTLSVSGQT